MRTVRSIVTDPDKVAGARIIREIPGQGYEIEWDVPEPEVKEELKLLRKIATKLGVNKE